MFTSHRTAGVADKAVVITGGARGIGRATAKAFLAAGARVAIGDLDAQLAERTAAELSATTGGRVTSGRLDVTRRDSFAAFLDQAEVDLGQLQVVVNNAGIMPTGYLLEETDAMTDRMLDINLRGVITGSKLAARRFVQQGGGSVVNIASMGGLFGTPGLATYAATKAAVMLFSDSLGLELTGTGVSVSAVLPGVVRTELSAGANYPAWLEPIVTVDPDDVAAAVVRAVTRPRGRVLVPRPLGTLIKVQTMLPTGLRRRFDQRVGLDQAFTHADPAARERYHRRLTDTTSG